MPESNQHQELDTDPNVDVLSRHVWGHPHAEQALKSLLEQLKAAEREIARLRQAASRLGRDHLAASYPAKERP